MYNGTFLSGAGLETRPSYQRSYFHLRSESSPISDNGKTFGSHFARLNVSEIFCIIQDNIEDLRVETGRIAEHNCYICTHAEGCRRALVWLNQAECTRQLSKRRSTKSDT